MRRELDASKSLLNIVFLKCHSDKAVHGRGAEGANAFPVFNIIQHSSTIFNSCQLLQLYILKFEVYPTIPAQSQAAHPLGGLGFEASPREGPQREATGQTWIGENIDGA